MAYERSDNTPCDDPSHRPCSLTRQELLERFTTVRRFSGRLCEPLETEDYVVQSMEDASPTKWHLAHTTWFFEAFVLIEHAPGYTPYNDEYFYLFNSYYVQAGRRYPRPRRGLITRPTVKETFRYREHVDNHMVRLLEGCGDGKLERLAHVVEIGIHHEQQHQELLLTDIKHALSYNPLHPVYAPPAPSPSPPYEVPQLEWVEFEGGLVHIGSDGTDFAYDNELPRHKVHLEPYRLGSRLVTNGEFVEFIEDGGYDDPLLWLSDGWAAKEKGGWTAPLYWKRVDGEWHHFTLSGLLPVDPAEPVCHVSFFEADAFARWAGARLPTEAEWEWAAHGLAVRGNFVEDGRLRPAPPPPLGGSERLLQLFGDVWEWTSSPYRPYPGYQPPPGALGEYNGKFMNNQYVLRGGSCATSITHIRATYRNFFYPHQRWQFMGVRLAS